MGVEDPGARLDQYINMLAYSCGSPLLATCPSCHQKRIVEFGEYLSHVSIVNHYIMRHPVSRQ
jgi:hypothetical protein